jgi:AraC-like DNA-binding protein
MHATLGGVDLDRLERSCSRDSIRFGTGGAGFERAEVFLSTCAFEPHRHDTYAIGITTAGVQTFRYRGSRRICLPGQLHVLHPDELHDGAAGTEDGFGYRILYVAPDLVRQALDGAPLPLVPDPVQRATPAIASLLRDIDEPLDGLACVDAATTVADTLRSLAGGTAGRAAVDDRAVALAREYLDAHAVEQTHADVLEQVTGVDRFTLARHFRLALGTSPDRYRILRRLELARTAIEAGLPLVQAAAQLGFADQSHLTRQFKRAYGLTPARWTHTIAAVDAV